MILVLLFECLLWRMPGWASAGQSRGASPNRAVSTEARAPWWQTWAGEHSLGTRECHGEGIPREDPEEEFVCAQGEEEEKPARLLRGAHRRLGR